MNIEVREYKNAKQFQKDAQKMLNAGWHMEGQSSRGGPAVGAAAAGALLLGPLGLLAGARRGRTTVTWMNDEPLVPERSNNDKLRGAGEAVVQAYLTPFKGPVKKGWRGKLQVAVLRQAEALGLDNPAAPKSNEWPG